MSAAAVTSSSYDGALNASMPANSSAPPSERFEVFEAMGYIGLLVAAFVANIVSLSTILRNKRLRNNKHNLLIVNLNIIDLCITMFSLSFSVGSFFDGGAFLKNNHGLCRFNGFCATTFTVGSFTTTLAIAIDRYLTVVWSHRFPPTRKRILILIAYTWTVALIFSSIPTSELLSKYAYSTATHHCSPKWGPCSYYILRLVHIYGIIVSLMIFCYVSIFRTIRQKENRLRAYDVKSSSSMGKSVSSAASMGETVDEKRSSEFPSDSVTEGEKARWPINSQNDSITQASALDDDSLDEDIPLEDAGNDTKNVKFALGPSSENELPDATVSQSEDDLLSQTKKKEKKRKMKLRNLSADKQVALTGALLVLTTVICWTPYKIIHACFFDINLSHPLNSLTMWVAYSNSLLDPLIYTFMNRRARAAANEHRRNIKNRLAEICC